MQGTTIKVKNIDVCMQQLYQQQNNCILYFNWNIDFKNCNTESS